ncbi:MAG: 30S ribosomal protein S9 [Candidatus Micrarchaeia archaeon]
MKVVVARGKRKSSIARAYVKEGKGVVRVNRVSVDAIQNRYVKNIIMEPILLAGEKAKGLDVMVNVAGGGVMGQAEAARTAIARGIVEFTGDAELKERMQERDRFMLLEDVRRVEPKKYKGPKARARFQKSYR